MFSSENRTNKKPCVFCESRFDNQSSNNLANSQTNVLLQTALVTVTDLHKQKQSKINALLDTGSQGTYVSEEPRNYLKLPALRKEKIIIKIFGTEDTCLKTVDVVPLKLLSSSKEIVVEALCTPAICSNVLNQDVKTVSNHYEHLKNLQLADFSNESSKCIDVLISVDYYYSCILGETKRGKDSGPIAVNSCFGWIICDHYENSIVSTNLNSVHMLRANTKVSNDYDFKQENIFNDFKKLFNLENHGSNVVIDDVIFLSKMN